MAATGTKKWVFRLAAAGICGSLLVAGCAHPGRPREGTATFSSYLGGNRDDLVQDLAVARDGSIFLVGVTGSTDFPTANAIQADFAGGPRNQLDAFVAAFTPGGRDLIYSTYLGGGYYDYGSDCAIADDGTLVLTGKTLSRDFPTREAFQPANHGKGDAFVARLGPDGRLLSSSFLGGSRGENLRAPGKIAIGPGGKICVSGTTPSRDFPEVKPLPGVVGGGSDAFIALLDPSARQVLRCSRVGGSKTDFCFGLALDSAGRPCLTGQTGSTDFPRTPRGLPYRGEPGYPDAFVSLIDLEAGKIIYSGFLGGSRWDFGHAVGCWPGGDIVVAGRTTSRDFPTVRALQPTYAGGSVDGDLFVSRLRPDSGELIFSTFLGGGGDEPKSTLVDLTLDPEGNIWLSAGSDSRDYPAAGTLPLPSGEKLDAVISALASDGQSLLLSGRIGGRGIDFARAVELGSRRVYLAGGTYSGNFPTRNPFQAGAGNLHVPGDDDNFMDGFFLGFPLFPTR